MELNEKHYLSPNEYLHDTWRLADQVVKSGWKPDTLIALWRGGAPVGVAMHEFFDAVGLKIQHVPLKCASYTGIGENNEEVQFTLSEGVFDSLHVGEKVLVVDDIFDTGKTAAAVKRHLDERGVEMRIACVYWKPKKNRTTLKPDYFVRDVGLEWIVFPHEIAGLTKKEIAQKDPLLSALI